MSTLGELFNLRLPDYWTPAEALAVYELLNELADAIWIRYEPGKCRWHNLRDNTKRTRGVESFGPVGVR